MEKCGSSFTRKRAQIYVLYSRERNYYIKTGMKCDDVSPSPLTTKTLSRFNCDYNMISSTILFICLIPLIFSWQTSVGGTTEELVPGGSQVPVTPENICKYVR